MNASLNATRAARFARIALRAASITRSASFTLDPPNFCTTTVTANLPMRFDWKS